MAKKCCHVTKSKSRPLENLLFPWQIFTVGILKILKNKASKVNFLHSAIKKMVKIWHYCEFFHFYPTLDCHKIRTRTDFENPNGKSLDLHLIL